MLLNANMLLFSGVVPWFDIRLNGENDDPLKMREETIVTTWNGWGQGVQSLAMWRPAQDSKAMINLMTTFAIPFRLSRTMTPRDVGEWQNSQAPDLALTREFWGIWRFFGLNGAEKFSSFDARDVVRMTEPGSIVNGFARDGRALVVVGVQGGAGVRDDALRILSPARLGLRDGLRYRLVDLRNNRYVGAARSVAELDRIAVRLTGDDPLILLLEPEHGGPGLVWFRGADGVAESAAFEFQVQAVPGSPLELFMDEAGQPLRALTPGFERKPAGDFAAFSGLVPEDGVVKLAR